MIHFKEKDINPFIVLNTKRGRSWMNKSDVETTVRLYLEEQLTLLDLEIKNPTHKYHDYGETPGKHNVIISNNLCTHYLLE